MNFPAELQEAAEIIGQLGGAPNAPGDQCQEMDRRGPVSIRHRHARMGLSTVWMRAFPERAPSQQSLKISASTRPNKEKCRPNLVHNAPTASFGEL